MKRNLFFTSLSVALAVFSGCSNLDPDELFSPEHVLWYDEPAELWEETLPLGNGRLGMMPDGGVTEERIVLNEISMWSGSEADYSNHDAAESLPEIRQLLLEGRNAEAQEVMYERFVPHKPSDGGTYGGYQTLGDLHIFCRIRFGKHATNRSDRTRRSYLSGKSLCALPAVHFIVCRLGLNCRNNVANRVDKTYVKLIDRLSGSL